MNNGYPYLVAQRMFVKKLDGWQMVITEIKEKNIDLSNHLLREKMIDWMAHWGLNKDCSLLETCNDLKKFLKLGKVTCMLCDFANVCKMNKPNYSWLKEELREPLYSFQALLSNKYDRLIEAQKNKGLVIPSEELLLVDLQLYQPRGFAFGKSRQNKPDLSEKEVVRDGDLFLEVDISDDEEAEETQELIFELIVGKTHERLETTDLEEALEQARFIRAAAMGKVVLWEFRNGKKEVHII